MINNNNIMALRNSLTMPKNQIKKNINNNLLISIISLLPFKNSARSLKNK
jgi:hypothetical protein